LEYLPASQLTENPANWRLHPPEQMAALDSVMTEVGWAGALLFNERTGRLLDGHARRQLFASRGGEVPVLIGSWDEAAERKILTLLDAVGDLAETDQDKLRALTEEIQAALPADGEERAARMLDALDAAVAPKMDALRPIMVPTVTLKPHPRNYRVHPPDQLEHLAHSIQENGFYRPVIVAKEHTILAGHGAVMAAIRLGMVRVPVVRLPMDPNDPRALKLLAADNEVSHLAGRDDRVLADLLKEILKDGDLMGTGYDERMLAGLAFVTRSRGEVADFDAAAEWVGMPEYEPGGAPIQLVMRFQNEADRDEFVRVHRIAGILWKQKGMAAWWPPRETSDLKSLRWEDEEHEKPE
jgi:hypothetical protein